MENDGEEWQEHKEGEEDEGGQVEEEEEKEECAVDAMMCSVLLLRLCMLLSVLVLVAV